MFCKLLCFRGLKCLKIQGTYFKISALYFKIYGLYFLRDALCFLRCCRKRLQIPEKGVSYWS